MKTENKATLVVITLIIMIACLLNVFESKAQEFNQFNATNMLYNPAFAGSLIDGRLSIDERIERNHNYMSSALKGFTNRYYAGYDQYSSKLKGGIGVYITGHNDIDNYNKLYKQYNNDSTKELNTYRTNSFDINIAYAPKIKLSDKFTLSPAINFNFNTNSESSRYTKYNYSTENNENHEYIAIDNIGAGVSFGLLLNARNFYLGLSTSNCLYFNKQHWHEEDFWNSSNFTDGYYFTQTDFSRILDLNLQSSYTFKFKNKDIAITPSIMMKFGQELLPYTAEPTYGKYGLRELFISTNIKYKKLELGIGIRTNYGLIGQIAYNIKNLRIGYSIALDPFKNNQFSHELSIRYIIKDRANN